MTTEKAQASAAEQSAPAGACTFCGRAWQRGLVTRSDEHVWGALRNDDRELPASRMAHVFGFATSPSGLSFIELPTVTTTNKASPLKIITREVCKDCNGGWMSRLEQRAKLLIQALSDAARGGAPAEFSVDQWRTVAMWAQKTAITSELAGRPPIRVATTAMGQRLRGGLPLRGSVVWAGRNTRDFWPGTAHALASIGVTPRPLPGEIERHGMLTMIVYRYISLVVFIGGDHGDLPPMTPPPLLLDRWTRIWPALGPVDYPPSVALDSSELARTMLDQRAWYPLSQIEAFHRSPFPPQVINRN